MRIRQTIGLLGLAIAWVCGTGRAHAQSPGDWSFSLPAADVSGPAGSTVGWGYTFTNNSTDWLFVTDVSSDASFEHGTATNTPFDFPVVAPNSSVTENYNGTTGLADLNWDADAPVGFVNSGDFVVSASFYDGDPFAGGNFIGDAGTQQAAYRATVIAPSGSAVPEPGPSILFGAALIPLCVSIRRKTREGRASGSAAPAD